MKIQLLLSSFILLLMSSCIPEVKVHLPKKLSKTVLSANVSQVVIKNNQIILTGQKLDNVTDFKIQGYSQNFQIMEQSASRLAVSPENQIAFKLDKAFNFILSTASASAVVPVQIHLDVPGAQVNDFLQFNGTSWDRSSLNGLNYKGLWKPGDGNDPGTSVQAGDYYIVSDNGSHLLNGVTNWTKGDWAVFADNTTGWQKIDNSTGTFNLEAIGNVQIVSPVTNQVLSWDGSKWVNRMLVAPAETDPNVRSFAKNALPLCDGNKVLKSDGTSLSCVNVAASVDWMGSGPEFIALSRISLAGTNRVMITNSLGNPASSAVTASELLMLSGASSNIQTQLNAKLSAETDPSVKSFAKNDLPVCAANYVLTSNGTTLSCVLDVSGGGSSGVAQTYVDTQDDLKVNKSGDTISGVLILESDLRIKGGTGNYVSIKGHATSAQYNFTLPPNAGSAGYILSTDGAGNTSWVSNNPGSGSISSSDIVDGTIVNADISSSAAIDQSKISNLVSTLAGKQSTSLTNGRILVGNSSGVAAEVAMAGDATLDNSGVLALKNTGSAGTYSIVTTDAQGRVVSGSKPTTLSGYGITDSIISGLAVTAPLIDVGLPGIPSIEMPSANSTTSGYVLAADWVNFNSKQAAISSTTQLNTGSISTNLQGGVNVNPYGVSAGNTGEVRFKDLAGVNYVAIKSPDTVSSNMAFILPTGVGTLGQVLTTNGGNPAQLSWSDNLTTGSSLSGDVSGTIGATTIGSGRVTLSHLSATGTKSAATYLAGDNTWKTLGSTINSSSVGTLSTAGLTKANSTIASGDTYTTALNKLLFTQGDYLSKTAASQTITGTLIIDPSSGFLRVPTPNSGNDAVNKDYVDGFGQWIKNGNDISFSAGNVGVGGAATATYKLGVAGSIGADEVFSAAWFRNTITGTGWFNNADNVGLKTGTGVITVQGTARITNVQDPVNAQDVATKAYVDGNANGFAKRKIFTASNTWTVPAGVSLIMVDVWGAGGGSGGTSSGAGAGTGGTGGATSITGLLSVNGGGGGGGSNSSVCNNPGGAGAGGNCTSTDDYECVRGDNGTLYSYNGSCTVTITDGGYTASAKTPWGMELAGPRNGALPGGGRNAGGGGGGAYAKGVFSVTPGDTLTLNIGAGGAGGTGTYAGTVGGAGKIIIWY